MTPALAPGTIISERYRVESLLGQGAMGAVYLVEHIHMRKRLALKVLLPEMSGSDEVVARFEREAMAAGHIDHPNVVAATDFGRMEGGAFFLVLELVEGQSLRDALASGPLEAGRAATIATQIASGLARAHELGIVHRDLKPDNVMLVRREGSVDELVKVLDFGIAKATGLSPAADNKALTQLGQVFGTPEYMAPEQARGEAVDARADLYALGVTLYEMLTGLRPFDGDTAIAVLTMQVAQPPPPPSERAPRVHVPPALEALVMRLMAKDPGYRPQTAAAVHAELNQYLAERGDGASERVVSGAAVLHTAANIGSPTTSVASELGHLPTALPAPPTSRAYAAADVRTWFWERRRTLLPALGGAAFLSLLMVVLAAKSCGPRAHPNVVDGGAASTTPWLPFAGLSDSKLRDASKRGVEALLALEAEYPKDARVPREIAAACSAQGRHRDALAALGRLAALDAQAAANADMDRVLDVALDVGTADDVDAALLLLEGPLGARGVDVLMERAAAQGPHRAKFQRSLKKPDVRAHASPAASVVLDLREAKSCEAKKELLPQAAAAGDARALALITTFKRTSGCGFFARGDCYRCMRKDAALAEAISALEAKKK